MERENVLLGYTPRGSLQNSVTTSYRNSEDLDFNDVFGGPPRRFSIQEVRVKYSFNESAESEEGKALSPWTGQKEKPVFGTESVTRRRIMGDGFFDDIFGGDEAYSSPRRTDIDRDNVFGSSPGSRNLSPARPLPPKAEAFSTSVPAQFSLPAKLTKATDFPKFASGNNIPYKTDGSVNGISSPRCSNSPLSRFSSQSVSGQDDMRIDVPQVYHQSPLSNDISFSNEDSTHAAIYDQKDSKGVETSNAGDQFHFSIYKWASREVPMMIPLQGWKSLKLKEKNGIDRSASSNGRIERMNRKLSTVENHGISSEVEAGSLKNGSVKQEEGSAQETNCIEEAFLDDPDLKSQMKEKDTLESPAAKMDIAAKEVKSLHEINIGEKTENLIPVKTEESHKPLNAALNNVNPLKTEESHKPEAKPLMEANENLTRTPKGAIPIVHADKNVKRNEFNSNGTEMVKDSQQTSPMKPEKVLGRSGAKGKVSEFVKIFNQEVSLRSKVDLETRSQNSRWKGTVIHQSEIGVSPKPAKLNEKFQLHSETKMPDISPKVNENLNNDEAKQYSHTKTPGSQSNHISTDQKDAIYPDSLPNDSIVSAENVDPFEDIFEVEELSHDHNNVTHSESSEDIKASDAKIHQWSQGKKGNIRSLLSTLQFVLWPESGWKPVPLVNLIEGNSVRRAYQKAMLCLHPDKLQQKGAASHQKYIAEKVFDILQEAWDHFNTLAPL